MRAIYALVFIYFITACSHPLEIVGEGDIVSSTGENDCSLEEQPCENHVTGDYNVTYTAVPRYGWEFSRWQGCDIQFPDCTFNVPGEIVDQFAGEVMPPLVAIFDQGLARSVEEGIEQQAYLKASDAESDDFFGSAIDISRNTLVVGAPGKDIMGTGLDAYTLEPAEGLYLDRGAVYVLSRSSGNWVQQAYLTDSQASGGRCINGEEVYGAYPGVYVCSFSSDRFGSSVAISGDTLVVGAPYADTNGTGGYTWDAGAVYVFTRKDGRWSQTALLKAPDSRIQDYFGSSLALSGDTLAVGAFGRGDYPRDESVDRTQAGGGVYIFSRKNGVWRHTALLRASNSDPGDRFGTSLAFSDGILAVGAPGEDSIAELGQTDNSTWSAGAVYVFARIDEAWIQTAFLKASGNVPGLAQQPNFGQSVSFIGDTIAVGAPKEDRDNGAVYVFVKRQRLWFQTAHIKNPNPSASRWFGNSIALSEEVLLVGNKTGPNATGAVLIFTGENGAWNLAGYLQASNAQSRDEFSQSLALSGSTIAVGAPQEDSSASGGESDNSEPDAGAVYVFE